MTSTSVRFFGVVVGLLAVLPTARAQEAIDPLYRPPMDEDLAVPVDESSALWFVELASPPLVEGTSAATLDAEHREFRARAWARGVRFRERFAYGLLWNGLSVRADRGNLSVLTRLPGVKAVWPVIALHNAQTTATPDLLAALAMSGADVAQTELGLTGAGVHVAIIDSGIDYDHPDLGGCFGPGCRVAFGYDFVGDAFNADSSSPAYDPNPVPDPDPDDCGGHGTHVAGIVGASPASSLGARGVAPLVTFGAYRVFGCAGSTTADVMLTAMEQALADGMDVLNMSIGSAFQWPEYPTAVGADRLVKAGMIVAASIGNSGANGLYAAGAPGVGKRVIGVASLDNSHVTLATFALSDDGTVIGYAPATGAPLPPITGTYLMARTGTAEAEADACSELPPGSLAGRVALIRRGSCTYLLKARNAAQAGALAVVVYNNVPGRMTATVAATPPVTLPVVTISDQEGLFLDRRIAAGSVSLTWTDQLGLFALGTAGLASSFTSYGLPPDLSFKPDLAAPGGSIRSTYPLERGAYAILSGTSMSSPHVAGAAALLLQARPRTSPEDVLTLLQNTADPRLWWGNPALGFLDNVHRVGAGLVDVDDAVTATARVKPSKLALGESQAGPAARLLTLHNDSRRSVTYDLGHEPALATGGSTFAPEFFIAPADVQFATPSLTVPARSTRTIRVTITAPIAPDRGLYGGYLVFAARGGDTYRVPYAGFIGDYQSIPVLTPTTLGLPWLAKLTDQTYAQQTDGASFSVAGDDLVYVLYHLDHQVERFVLRVYDASTGRYVGRVARFDHVRRNSTANGYFVQSWDGTLAEDDDEGGDDDDDDDEEDEVEHAPDGDYFLELDILKALGHKRNPAHRERWVSPVFTLSRS